MGNRLERQRVTPQHHALTLKHNGRADRLITPVIVWPAFDVDNPPDPLPGSIQCPALWDTGATGSVITASTASVLGLVPVGVVNVNHAGGISQSNRYLVNIGLPNNVNFAGVLVSECPDNTGSFGLIIGMDIIASGDFAITNIDGKTVLSFCFPSWNTIDYVAEINNIRFAGTGRNEPCPCGKLDTNGKRMKYKFCHGR